MFFREIQKVRYKRHYIQLDDKDKQHGRCSSDCFGEHWRLFLPNLYLLSALTTWSPYLRNINNYARTEQNRRVTTQHNTTLLKKCSKTK